MRRIIIQNIKLRKQNCLKKLAWKNKCLLSV
jgi:hypothetical protein